MSPIWKNCTLDFLKFSYLVIMVSLMYTKVPKMISIATS